MWHEMFSLGIPLVEKIARPVIIYFFLVIAVRLFGKRELAQLNAFDFVVLLLISNTVQNAIIGEDNTIVGGVVGALTLFVTNWLVIRFLYRHERLDRIVEGDPDVLINGGRIDYARLQQELITVHELERAAHKQGFASLQDIDRAVLEPGGGICFFGRQPQPEARRHEELLARLDKLSQEIAALRA
jgi:uncharacterized membrane protein YcaP (DUF421 family)